MSAGPFEIVAYETSDPDLGGAVLPIKIQPETALLFIAGTVNAPSVTPINWPVRVAASAGNNEYGVKPRRVTIRFTDQAVLPDGYKGDDLMLPVLTTAAAAAYVVGSTGTYLGAPVQVISKSPERYR